MAESKIRVTNWFGFIKTPIEKQEMKTMLNSSKWWIGKIEIKSVPGKTVTAAFAPDSVNIIFEFWRRDLE